MMNFINFAVGLAIGIAITLFLLRESIFRTTQLTEEEAEWIRREIINLKDKDD